MSSQSYATLKASEGYREILESLKQEIVANRASENPAPVAEIVVTYRSLLLEYVESEGMSVAEYYAQGDESVAHWGWSPSSVFPNYTGMNEVSTALLKHYESR